MIINVTNEELANIQAAGHLARLMEKIMANPEARRMFLAAAQIADPNLRTTADTVIAMGCQLSDGTGNLEE